MKKIELFERAIAEKARNLKDYGINSTMFWAYRKSMEAGNDSIDFGEVIWDEDIDHYRVHEGKRHHRIYHKQHIFQPDSYPRSL